MDFRTLASKQSAKYQGKLATHSLVYLRNAHDLSVAYTPGVAQPCLDIAKTPQLARALTLKGRTVAVVSNSSAVLGLGNLGLKAPVAGLPVMEGKCLLMKRFAGVDAFPIIIDSQSADEIVAVVKAISPTFGAINLEDIKAPEAFEIEERLRHELDIPVFHDDQHGTAIVVLAGLTNALKVVGKKLPQVRIVISGAGAAGIAITKLLVKAGAKHLLLTDSKGILYSTRAGMNTAKQAIAKITNKKHIKGTLSDALIAADVFIGVSAPNIVKVSDIQHMNRKAVVFAMANPDPEIMPDDAKRGGAAVVATGRSDFPNQVNNVLAFPGILKGALTLHLTTITDRHKLNAAKAIAKAAGKPTATHILPSPFMSGLANKVVTAMKHA